MIVPGLSPIGAACLAAFFYGGADLLLPWQVALMIAAVAVGLAHASQRESRKKQLRAALVEAGQPVPLSFSGRGAASE